MIFSEFLKMRRIRCQAIFHCPPNYVTLQAIRPTAVSDPLSTPLLKREKEEKRRKILKSDIGKYIYTVVSDERGGEAALGSLQHRPDHASHSEKGSKEYYISFQQLPHPLQKNEPTSTAPYAAAFSPLLRILSSSSQPTIRVCEVTDVVVIPFELASSTLSSQANAVVLWRLAAWTTSFLAAPGVDIVLCGGAELPMVVTALMRTWCELMREG
jgi:hypothetical protein